MTRKGNSWSLPGHNMYKEMGNSQCHVTTVVVALYMTTMAAYNYNVFIAM